MIAKRNADDRRRAENSGRRGEQLAALFLSLKGYSVLHRRYRTPRGEIDLVARKGHLIVFVEVKSRKDEDAALFAVTPSARRRISGAAALYLSRFSALAAKDVRYDIITIAGWRIRHIRNAWRDGE